MENPTIDGVNYNAAACSKLTEADFIKQHAHNFEQLPADQRDKAAKAAFAKIKEAAAKG